MNDLTKHSIFDICKKYEEIIVIDVYNYIFKYFYAHNDLSVTTKDGEVIPTGHIYGFTKNILFLKDHFPKCAIILCVDGKDTSRSELYPEYKAGREHQLNPGDYIGVIEDLCSIIDGVYICYDPSYEADDAAGSSVRTLKYLCNKFNIPKQIYLLSSDRDWWQLIDDGEGKCCRISAVKKWGMGNKFIEEAQFVTESVVREEFNGTSPENLLKFRSITGDSSDNIKGYYRFYKKNAAIIAENFDYDTDTKCLVIKDGIEQRQSWQKFLEVVQGDMSIFSRNYELMSLKEFDFTLVPIFKDVSESKIKSIIECIKNLELNTFLEHIKIVSPYRDILNKYVEEVSSLPDEVTSDIRIDNTEVVSQELEDIIKNV